MNLEALNNNIRLFNLPFLANTPGGLERFDSETLRRYVDPIWRALQTLDAESLLHLQRTESGTRLNESTFVHPIHNEIVPCRPDRGSGAVRYLHVGESPGKYSIGIFVFPPHARIPLHDHPGMCVLSRVLYGDLARTSMDLTPETRSSWLGKFFLSPSKKGHRVNNVRKDHLQSPDITMLYPVEGNLHEFIAGPYGAAVLDVLLPPYGGDEKRECTFYSVAEEPGGTCWIQATEQPEDFHCLSGSYCDLGEIKL